MSRRGWRAVIAAAALAACLALGAAAASRSLWYEANDFYCVWSAARLVVEGPDPYDPAAWGRATGGLHPDPRGGVTGSSCGVRFSYPLWTAVAVVPFGLLPLPAAASLWAGLSLAAAAGGAIAAWRASGGGSRGAALYAAIVLTAQPLWVLVVGGQLTGMLLGLAGSSALWLSRASYGAAGTAYGLLALKPQLVALSGPALVVWSLRRRTSFAVAATAAVVAMALITLAIAPRWPIEWLAQLDDHRSHLVSVLATAWGLSADLFGTVWVAPLLIAATIGGCWSLARGRATPVGVAAMASALSLVATPYAWSYDHLLLVVPWALTLAIAMRSPARRRTALLLGIATVASLLPWTLYAFAFARGRETLSVLVPALTALLAAAAVGSEPAGGALAVDERSAPPRGE